MKSVPAAHTSSRINVVVGWKLRNGTQMPQMSLFSLCVSVLGMGVVAPGLFMQPEGGKELQGLTAKTRLKIKVTFVEKSSNHVRMHVEKLLSCSTEMQKEILKHPDATLWKIINVVLWILCRKASSKILYLPTLWCQMTLWSWEKLSRSHQLRNKLVD